MSVDVAWEEVQRQFEVLGLGRKDKHRRIQSSVAYSSLIPVLPVCREPWVLADQVNWCQYTAAAVPVLKSKLNSHFFLKSSLLVNCCPLPARAVLEVWLICHRRVLKGHFVAWLAGQSLQDHSNYKIPISFYLFIYLFIDKVRRCAVLPLLAFAPPPRGDWLLVSQGYVDLCSETVKWPFSCWWNRLKYRDLRLINQEN